MKSTVIEHEAPPRVVLFLTYPTMGLLDLTGAQTVFWAADKAMKSRGLRGFDRLTASVEGGLMETAEGVSIQTDALSQIDMHAIDTFIIPGSPDVLPALRASAGLVQWIVRAAAQVRRVASVCTGAFFLAEAGLLDDKRAATHWSMGDALKELYPGLVVDLDAIYLQQGQVWTSAGVTAGIDLALAMVEEDCGREVAMEVARLLVVFMKRAGGQSQQSHLLRSQMADSEMFADLHAWISENLNCEDLNVEMLARQVGMSARNFTRVYKQKTGNSPAKAVELFRLDSARRMLQDSDRNIDQIAVACGYGDEERMRVSFQRNMAVSPREYRRQSLAK